jgi:hypothetical protein
MSNHGDWIVGSVKNRQKGGNSEHNRSPRHSYSISNTSIFTVKNTGFIERTHEGQIRDAARFGKVEWETYFGDIGEEPSLPGDIEGILSSPCPFSGDKSVKVKDTHILVLIPQTINNKPVTLNNFQKSIQNPKQGHKTDYYFYDSNMVQEQYGNTPVEQSHWVLMTRDIIPKSRNKSFANQKAMLKGTAYVVPQAVEAVVCIIAEFVVSRTRLYDYGPLITYTRCTEIVRNNYPVIVGGFDSSNGLVVNDNFCNSDYFGIAALRRF